MMSSDLGCDRFLKSLFVMKKISDLHLVMYGDGFILDALNTNKQSLS